MANTKVQKLNAWSSALMASTKLLMIYALLNAPMAIPYLVRQATVSISAQMVSSQVLEKADALLNAPMADPY